MGEEEDGALHLPICDAPGDLERKVGTIIMHKGRKDQWDREKGCIGEGPALDKSGSHRKSKGAHNQVTRRSPHRKGTGWADGLGSRLSPEFFTTDPSEHTHTCIAWHMWARIGERPGKGGNESQP